MVLFEGRTPRADPLDMLLVIIINNSQNYLSLSLQPAGRRFLTFYTEVLFATYMGGHVLQAIICIGS